MSTAFSTIAPVPIRPSSSTTSRPSVARIRASLRDSGPSLAVVGVTGAVGQEFLSVISDRDFPFQDRDYLIEELTGDSFDGVDKNLVSHSTVVQQVVQAVVAMLLFTITQNKFLYKHVQSLHHRLVVPYSFGALYNHPLEGLLLDTVGTALSFLLSGMSPRASIFFFSFATIKTVDDHIFFKNNTAYHDIHHQLYGSKYNFSQPFFITWDKILGTYMPYTLEKIEGGGFEARPTKEYKDS